MAEVVGLTLSVLGIAGLFKACIDNFDIVVRAREFSQEFEYLCTKLAIHRTRLVLWGETLGIAQAEKGGGPAHYIRSLEHPIIKPTVESCLFQLCDLLGKADIVSENYSLKDEDPREGSDSKGLAVLRDTFERIREGIHKNQKQKSVRKVTKWAVHDHAKFEDLVHKIGALLDGLEKVLEALGRFEAYQSQFEREIETISDEDSLSRLEEVCSSVSAPLALRAISDTASMRLTIITSSSKSYQTAKSTQLDDTQGTEGTSVAHNGVQRAELPVLTLRSQPQLAQQNTQDAAFESSSKPSRSYIDMPHHQRWMAALVAHQSPIQRPLSFSESDLSAVPVGDSLDKLLGSIEGPPGTPYEGGIFWIKVRLVDMSPPIMQFHTRIFHPNIDCTGRLCVDYTSWRDQVAALNHRAAGNNLVHWFSERITNHCSLGALLVALSGLLASPNLEDPLVPEIAEKYIMDYEGYCEEARRLTWRYARGGRPDEESIEFPTEHTGSKIQATPYVTPEPRPRSLTRSEVHVDVENLIESEYEYEREPFIKGKDRQESGSEDEQERELRSLAESQSELEENRPRPGGVLLDGIPVDCKKDAVENWMRELGSEPKAMQPDPPYALSIAQLWRIYGERVRRELESELKAMQPDPPRGHIAQLWRTRRAVSASLPNGLKCPFFCRTAHESVRARPEVLKP
ncbi:hypothetical protein DL765_005982 [Monosporascus sp. GIB2]|nr:hypothetical protein DL765_005982 [Monosporascus sp. GIB2]